MFHFRGRKVSRTEHLLHAGIGIALAMLFIQALMGRHLIVLGALFLFVLAGGIDEYIYHRDIPAEESDLHAKQHLALVIFIAVSLATDWLEKHDWSLAQLPALWHAEQGRGP
jgi:UDP-N-acetylmuramyl pentapeptide phosphotransferase/UDP-N-acetylglucosamine-1-phosphate transferase